MKSPITGKGMALKTEQQTIRYNELHITCDQEFYLCQDTGERFTTTKVDESNIECIQQEYKRQIHEYFRQGWTLYIDARGLQQFVSDDYRTIAITKEVAEELIAYGTLIYEGNMVKAYRYDNP